MLVHVQRTFEKKNKNGISTFNLRCLFGYILFPSIREYRTKAKFTIALDYTAFDYYPCLFLLVLIQRYGVSCNISAIFLASNHIPLYSSRGKRGYTLRLPQEPPSHTQFFTLNPFKVFLGRRFTQLKVKSMATSP